MKLLQFNTSCSMHNKKIKLHFVDDMVFASIKAKEEVYYYKEKFF